METRGRRESRFLSLFMAIIFLFGVVSVVTNFGLHVLRIDTKTGSVVEAFVNDGKSRESNNKGLLRSKGNGHNDTIQLTFHEEKTHVQTHPFLDMTTINAKRDMKPGNQGKGSPSKSSKNAYHLAGLNCHNHGGPRAEIAKEMVYWEDIPSDNRYVSPLKRKGITQYVTYELDGAGWNNVRMSMETVLALAVAMGRTLVLPPAHSITGLSNTSDSGKGQRGVFSFLDFYPLNEIAKEHAGFNMITTKEFLEREALTGNIRDTNGTVRFPPGNRTDWDGEFDVSELSFWLRNYTRLPSWNPEDCMAVFPATNKSSDIHELRKMKESVDKAGGFPSFEAYIGKPNPVDAPAIDRMKENWANRKKLCIYDEDLQNSPVVHFPHDEKTPGFRLLVHFYAFLFFQNWRHDLWMKRFIRDHLRYVDEIQCAAARVVNAVRERVRARGQSDGEFDSFHIRRGDFREFFRGELIVEAEYIYNVSRAELTPNATVYIATDERDRSYFDPLKKHYDVVFLDDFKDHIGLDNSNYYGMVDQLVASRSRVFFGCWFSTFSAYINRLRGYHANRNKSPGYEQGLVRSWYYAYKEKYDHMRVFYPVKRSYHAREFPASWRLIDEGVEY